MLKICLLIYKLDFGGTQRQTIELAKGLAEAGHDVTIMSCYDGGAFSDDIKYLGKIKYISLGKRGRWDLFGFMFRFVSRVRRLKPEVFYGFLTLANLLSVFARLFLPGVRVIWGVRASNMDLKEYGLLIWTTFKLECFFSRFAHIVIANSDVGKNYYQKVFSFSREITVVRNGIDTEFFKPDLEKREKQRAEWEISDSTTLIGMVGRMDPMKGYSAFIEAAAIFAEKHSEVCFVCVGEGPERYVLELKSLADSLGVSDRIIWAGFNKDIHQVYNALDIFTSASLFGEGFSNVIGEAMATGVSCVVTDVGDSSFVVGDTGIVVPFENPEALAAGWEAVIQKWGVEKQCLDGRQRVLDCFSIQQLVERTEETLCAVKGKMYLT